MVQVKPIAPSRQAALADFQKPFSARAWIDVLLDPTSGLGAQLSQAQRAQLESLRSESDEGLFWGELLNFGKGLEATEQLHTAAEIYTAIANTPLSLESDSNKKSLQEIAQRQLHAIQGKGSFGGRAEFLLRHFTRDATDPRVILPMMAGSVVYGTVRAAALSRLATATRGAWYTHGLAARLAATSLGFAAEVPTFALSARALRHAEGPAEGPSLGQELGSAALTLGFLKSFAFAGNQAFRNLHGISAHGVPQRLALGTRVSQFASTQGSMFTGLLAAHRAEEALGWRPHVDGATTFTDTLASMLSLSVGARLGHKVLGPRLATFLAETQGRSEWAGHLTDLAPGLRPLLATAPAAPGGMLLAMSIGSSSGRGAEPSGGDPSRIIRDLRIDLTSKDAKPKARRKALEDLKDHLRTQLQGDPCIPEGAKVLRELFEDKDDAVASAAMEHYGTLFLVGYDFGAAELRQGQRALERIRDDSQVSAARRKKADLALTYIEGGMELNDYAKLYPASSTLPLPEPREPRAINVERLFQLVLPTQLRKMFLDPEASEPAVQQAQLRYLTLMRSRPVDLAFEAELLELKRSFRAVPGQSLYLTTPEAQNAASAFVELSQRFSQKDFSRVDALTALRRIFTYEGLTRNPELLHRAFENYLRNLYLEDYANHPQWWHGELTALHEIVRGIQLVTVSPPSPWARRPQAGSAAPETLDRQTDMMILRAYVKLLRPLPTTHPTLASGMQMLERLSRRRAGVEPIKTRFIQQLLRWLREEKIRSIPETIAVKGWGMDPRNGKPVFIDRQIDPKAYEIREIQTPQGPQVVIEGSDLRMQLPGTRQTLGLGAIPFLTALGLGLETLLSPNQALASEAQEKIPEILSNPYNWAFLGACAAILTVTEVMYRRWRRSSGETRKILLEILAEKKDAAHLDIRIPPEKLVGLREKFPHRTFEISGKKRTEIDLTEDATIAGRPFLKGLTLTFNQNGDLIWVQATPSLKAPAP